MKFYFLMPRRCSIYFIALLALTGSGLSFAQGTSSPYSRFGLGELYHGFSAYNMAMGGTTFAFQNDSTAPFAISPANPASLASLRLSSFEVGVSNTVTQLKSNQEKILTNNVGLEQIIFGVPVGRKNRSAIAFGLQPYSRVGYNIGTESQLDSVGKVRYNYQGSGGINDVFLAGGFRTGRFSFGFSASHLFGNVLATYRDSFPSSGFYFNTRARKEIRVSDFVFRGGIQYKARIKSRWFMVAGLTGSMGTDMVTRTTTLVELLKFNTIIELARDTALYEVDVKETRQIPHSLGAGLMFKKGERLVFAADYFFQDWTSFGNANTGIRYSTARRLSLGFQYIPDKYADGKGNLSRRLQYRGGLRYSNHYLVLSKDIPYTEFSASTGLGIPLRKQRMGDTYTQSMLNFALEGGYRGTTENNLISETFFRISIGLSLNEKWFIQRKYD
jgi:hypothetical protein